MKYIDSSHDKLGHNTDSVGWVTWARDLKVSHFYSLKDGRTYGVSLHVCLKYLLDLHNAVLDLVLCFGASPRLGYT